MRQVNERILEPLARMTGLQILELQDTGIANKGMQYLSELRSLRSLELRESRISGPGLAQLQDLPHLEHLDCYTNATDTDLKYLGQVSSLRWIRMRMGRIRGPGLAQLGRLPHLERLCLWGSTGLTDRHVRYLTGLTRLKGLTLWGGSFSDNTLAFIGKLSNLEELYFVRCATNFTPLGYARLKGLEHLRVLDLGSSPIWEARFLEALPHLESVSRVVLTVDNMKALSGLGHLKSLHISSYHMSDGFAAASCLGDLSSLEELSFSGSDAEVACLESLGNLRRLFLWGEHLTDRSLQSVSRLQELESLSVDGSMTRAGLNQLNKLTNLWSLSVSVPSRNTVASDELTLNLKNLTNLRSLRLTGLPLQDDDLAFLPRLPHLQQLSAHSKSLSGETLKHLRDLSELNTLRFTGISDVGAEDLAHLSGLTKLGQLNLSGGIPAAALEHLPYLPALWSLWIRNAEPMTRATQARVRDGQSGHNISIHFRELNPATLGPVPDPQQRRRPIQIRSSQPRQRTPRTRRRHRR